MPSSFRLTTVLDFKERKTLCGCFNGTIYKIYYKLFLFTYQLNTNTKKFETRAGKSKIRAQCVRLSLDLFN